MGKDVSEITVAQLARHIRAVPVCMLTTGLLIFLSESFQQSVNGKSVDSVAPQFVRVTNPD